MNDQRRSPTSRARLAPARAEAELARLAKALGHPARIEILRMLIERGDCQCGAIVDRLPLAQATVSQHLKVLKDAGLIRGEIDPPRVCYCVNPQAIARLKTLIAGL